jgi:hypothetical protein
MTSKEPRTPPEGEQEQGGGVAVAEKPKKWEPQDHEKVTVLYGWNKVPSGYKQFVDKTLFKDGIARNVPYTTVKHWKQGTRPDGRLEMSYGSIGIQAVLPNDATEADFIKATGITPMPVEQFASQLAGMDINALLTHMGVEKFKALIGDMESHLPPAQRRA